MSPTASPLWNLRRAPRPAVWVRFLCLLSPCLLTLLLLAGCQSPGAPTEGAGADPAGDPAGDTAGEEQSSVQEPESRRPSLMLEQLRAANREAELEFKRDELGRLKTDRADLDQQLAKARARGEDTVTLEERRRNLDRVISTQERMLEQAGH